MVTRTGSCLLGLLAVLLLGTAPLAACVGDCDESGAVTVDEILRAVSIALGAAAPGLCPAADADGSGRVTVDEIVTTVQLALAGCPAVATPTATPTATATPSPAPVPTGAPLRDWLAARSYAEWTAESAPHDSLGPHFGRVRTYLNDSLLASLAAGNAEHPQGAAVVKELFGRSGTDVRGWAVMIKLAPSSAGGANWYWLEVYDSSQFADGPGVELCAGCHRSDFRGLTSRDLVLTPFPLL